MATATNSNGVTFTTNGTSGSATTDTFSITDSGGTLLASGAGDPGFLGAGGTLVEFLADGTAGNLVGLLGTVDYVIDPGIDATVSTGILSVGETYNFYVGGTLDVTGSTIGALSATNIYVYGGTLESDSGGAAGALGSSTITLAENGVLDSTGNNLINVLNGATIAFDNAHGGGTIEASALSGGSVVDLLSGSTVTGFATPDDVIDFDNASTGTVASYSVSVSGGTTTMTFYDSANNVIGEAAVDTATAASGLQNSGTYTAGSGPLIITPQGANSFTVAAACYAKGTRIMTPAGEVPVETLRRGDLVRTLDGRDRPIKWIGRRGYITGRMTQHERETLLPVRFVRGSLGNGLPRRDLLVSPEHMMFLDDVLIPARKLANGASIAQREVSPAVEYFHVELDSHDVLLAEGAPSESWRDTGNRNMFTNVLEWLELGLPDGARQKPCAPVVTEGPRLDAVRAQLARHIEAAGFVFTSDPDVHLLADGKPVRGEAVSETVYRFTLDAAPSRLVVGSRYVIPAETVAGSADVRRLGLCLKQIVLADASSTIALRHDEPSLAEGFHGAEAAQRWTDGAAVIPAPFLAPLSGPVRVEVHLAARPLTYVARAETPGEPAEEPAAEDESEPHPVRRYRLGAAVLPFVPMAA